MSTSRRAPPLTVAVPTIGRMDFLPSLLASLEAQTMGDFEALILDNASPPDAQDLFADWERKDSRFRVLRVDQRLPMFTNFNRGWLEMRGKYLVYFHDDDLYLPRFLAAQHDFLEREPRASFAGCNNDFIDARGVLTEERRWIRRTEVMPGKRFIEFVLSRGRNLVTMQSIAYRKAALAPRGIDDALSCHFGDFVIMMRMAETGGVGLIDEPLVRVRRHEGQFSVRGWRLSEAMHLRASMLRDYAAEYQARWPADAEFARTMESAIQRSIRVGSVLGWLNAPDEAEAAACLAPLGGSAFGERLRAVIRGIERLGVDSHTRRSVVAPLARRVGNALRI